MLFKTSSSTQRPRKKNLYQNSTLMEVKRSNPKYKKKAVFQPASGSPADIIKFGISNENAARRIEKDNTLLFLCEKSATKLQIKEAVHALYKANIKKVRTAISIKGYKKAFVVLKNEGEALKVANEAGII